MGAGVRPLTGDGQDLVAGRRLWRVCLTVTREPSKGPWNALGPSCSCREAS